MEHLPELNDGRFYGLLEALGEQARASVGLLARWVEEGGRLPVETAGPVQNNLKITGALQRHLKHAIISSLAKEDVQALSQALAGIPTAAERFAGRFTLAMGKLDGADFGPPMNWTEELVEILLDMIPLLRGFDSLYGVQNLYPRLQTVADHAEDSIQAIVNQAYQHPASSVGVLMVKDLGDQMMSIIERCREAGRLMNSISHQFL